MKRLLTTLIVIGMLIGAGGCNSNIGMLLSGKRTLAEFGYNARLATDPKFRRAEYVKARPNLDEQTKNAILNGQVFIGMTKEQVIYSWGETWNINKSVGRWGSHEQWVYGDGYSTQYIYFENGILTSWQN